MAKTFIRFTEVSIPQGATIRNAFIKLISYNDQTLSGVSLTVYCVDADNQLAPTSKIQLDGLPLTAGTVWSNLPRWEDDKSYNSINITSQLNSVVNRSGWVSGNAVVIVLNNSGGVSGIYRMFKTVDGYYTPPNLYASWFSYWKNYETDVYWQPAVLGNTDTVIGTFWNSDNWVWNYSASISGGRIRTKGLWSTGFRPERMKVIFTKTGANPTLVVETTSGTLFTYSNYPSGTEVILNWLNRGDILSIALTVDPADNTQFYVTGIQFKWLSSVTGLSTTSTSSTCSSTTSTRSTVSTQSTTTSSSSSSSTSSSSTSTSTSSSSHSTTGSTWSTHSTTTSSSTTSSTRSTVSTQSTRTTTTSSTTTSSSSSTSTSSSSSTTTTTA